jgi:intergrase/recombinase
LLKNIEMQMMKYCRKIFVLHLRESGNEGEIVDLLQGRVPKTVFARHYFTRSLDYRAKRCYMLWINYEGI